MRAYEAINESPRVFCAYGETPAKVLKNMAKVLKEQNIQWWSAAHTGYIEEDGSFFITIYI